MAAQELQVQEKREVQKEESTVPARFFSPHADIFETEPALTCAGCSASTRSNAHVASKTAF